MIWLDARPDGNAGTRATLTLPLLPGVRDGVAVMAGRDGAVHRG
jgi:hypothetical protein